MKTAIASLFFSVQLFHISAQGVNLVPNGSFRNFSALPNDDCDWALAQGWTNAVTTTFCNSSIGTPDYYNLCGSGYFSALPESYFATLLPFYGAWVMGTPTSASDQLTVETKTAFAERPPFIEATERDISDIIPLTFHDSRKAQASLTQIPTGVYWVLTGMSNFRFLKKKNNSCFFQRI